MDNRNYLFWYILGLLLIVQSCAFQDFKGKPDEQVVYNRIQELKQSERYVLAGEYAKKFKEHFPKSDKVEELDLFLAEQDYKAENWEAAKEGYMEFLGQYPNSPKIPYVQKQLQNIEVESVSFHKHFDYNIYIGPQLLSTGDISDATEAPNTLTHLSVSHYLTPNHGIFFGGQAHTFKVKHKKIAEASSRPDKEVNASILSLGYLHRWKLSRKINVVYGLGAGGERVRFIDGKAPNSGRTLGFNQFVTFDYCAFADDRNPCWNGIFPSAGFFHLYSPNATLGGNEIDGHLFGLGLGLRM